MRQGFGVRLIQISFLIFKGIRLRRKDLIKAAKMAALPERDDAAYIDLYAAITFCISGSSAEFVLIASAP